MKDIERREISNQIDIRRGVQRVAIIGAGAVGAAFAFALVHNALVREIVLIDKDERRAQGEMMDLSHCLPWGAPVKLSVGDLDAASDCDLVVITAGAAQRPGETRLDLVKRNADIFANFFPRLPKANPSGLFVIITNPVDIMTRLAVHLSELSTEQIFGTGTELDTARFRLLLGQHLKLDPRSINAYVIGEHGDSEVMVWSRATVGPHTLEEYGRLCDRPFTGDAKRHIEKEVRSAAYQIIERKGSTNFAIGVSMQRLFESITFNQARQHTVSRPLEGAYGLQDMCLSLPLVIERDGAEKPVEIGLSLDERAALMRSAEQLDEVFRNLGV